MASSKCTVCNKTPVGNDSVKNCGGCKLAVYCSTACQKSDWPLHKLVCKLFANLTTNTQKPSKHAALAFLLPVESKQPELIWIENDNVVKMGTSFNNPSGRHFLGDDRPRVEIQLVSTNVDPSFSLDYTLEVCGRDSFMSDGSKPNKCVPEITKGAHKHGWKGPIVIRSFTGTPILKRYQDVIPADLRVAVDFFKSYGGGVGKNEEMEFGNIFDMHGMLPNLTNLADTLINNNPSKVMGVMISCEGDQKYLDRDKYVPFEVMTTDPIFRLLSTSISTQMGLKINVQKRSHLPAWHRKAHKESKFNPYGNRTALYLNLDTDPRSEYFGFTNLMEWDKEIGPALVVRKDAVNITPHQVEALAVFCRFHLSPLIRDCEEDLGEAGVDEEAEVDCRKEFIAKRISKEEFEKFFENLKKERVEKGDTSWADAVSPYQG